MMKQLFYCGNNSYQQCPLMNSAFPKTINELTCILKENIETVQSTHRLSILKIDNTFRIHGMTSKSDIGKLKVLKAPINTKSYLNTDDFIFVANCYEFWKSDYSDKWIKIDYEWENKDEEELWKDGNEVKKFCWTNDSIYCLLDKGSIWKLEENGKVKLLYSPNVDRATDIASGFEHCLILTESGCALSFGIGSRGQLGHGDLNSLTKPVQISNLIGLKIIKIAAGGWHSCALADTGDLYTWGWNNFGQLGFPSADEISQNGIGIAAEPMVVDFQDDIKDVECGNRHTVIITDNDDFYATGWNQYGQLGIGDSFEKVYEFTKIKTNVQGKKKLICGPWCTLVLLIDENK